MNPELQPFADALSQLGYSTPGSLREAAASLAHTPGLLKDMRAYLSSGKPAIDYAVKNPSILFKPLPGNHTVAELMRDFALKPCGAFLTASGLLQDHEKTQNALDQIIAEGYWEMLPDGSSIKAFVPASTQYPACPNCGLRWTRDYATCPRCGYGAEQAQIDQDLEISELIRQATGIPPSHADLVIPEPGEDSAVIQKPAAPSVAAPRRKNKALLSVLSVASMLCGICMMVAGAMSLFSSPAASSQAPASSPAQNGWNTFQDDFSSPSTGWPQTDDASRMLGYSEGSTYGIALKTAGSDVNVLIPHGFQLPLNETDLYLRARPVQGKGYLGALCDYHDGGNLVYAVLTEGLYSIGRLTNGQAASFLESSWVKDPKVAAINGEYLILLHCGDTIQLNVNGYSLPAVNNQNRARGDIAILAQSDKEATLDPQFYYQVLIDDVKLFAR
jgi:hypothetical protein